MVTLGGVFAGEAKQVCGKISYNIQDSFHKKKINWFEISIELRLGNPILGYLRML